MDFLKESISNAGENAAKGAMIDQATNSVKSALGGGDNAVLDQASAFVKKTVTSSGTKTTEQATFMNQAQELVQKTVTKETTEQDDGSTKVEEKAKTDYVDKGISLVEEKVLNIKPDSARDEKIAGYVRAGIEKYTGSGSGSGGENNQQQQ